jgi:transposase
MSMAKAYDDDLRRKFLESYDQGKGSLEELAGQFGVSLGWAWKISAQRKRTGQAERVRHLPGRKPRVNAETERRVMQWVAAKSDLTLAEIETRLLLEAGVKLSRGRVWYLLRKLGLRLKKSRSMPPSATPKSTGSEERTTSKQSAPSRRRG